MKGAVSADVELAVPADAIWKIYGTSEIVELTPKLLPHLFEKMTIVGDGGAGSITTITFAPGFPGPKSLREKFVKVDSINRVKVIELIEGGYLSLGFKSYKVRSEITENGSSSSAIKITIEYEIGEGSAATPSLVNIEPLIAVAKALGKHIAEGRAKTPHIEPRAIVPPP